MLDPDVIESVTNQFAPQGPQSSTVLQETAKAVPRVVGGIATDLGEAAQYVTGDRVGGGLRNFGENLQSKYAMTPGFVEQHPIVAQAGQAAEGIATMAPYIAGDALLTAVAPEEGVAGLRGIVAKAAGKLSTVALPAVVGASTGQRTYELARQQGMDSDQALTASMPAAAVSAAGMALMGPLGKAGRALLPASEAAEGGVVKSILRPGSVARDIGGAVLADTPVMVGTNAATAAAQAAAGVTPVKSAKEIATDPKEWFSSALAGGMFGALHAAQSSVMAKAMGETLTDPTADPATRRKVANLVGAHLEGDAQTNWLVNAHKAIAEGQSIPVDDSLLKALPIKAPVGEVTPTPTETKAEIISALTRSATTGEAPIDAMNNAAEEQALQHLDTQIEEAHNPIRDKAEMFIQNGGTVTDRGKDIDPAVRAELDAQGYTAVPAVSTESGRNRQNWDVITHDEAAQRAAAVPEAPELPVTDRAAENKRLADAGFSGRAIKAMSEEERSQRLQELDFAEKGGLDHAEQEPGAAPVDGGSGTQPEVRAEGGDTGVSGEGVRSGGPEEGVRPETAQKVAPIADGENRQAFEDNPNLFVARRDGKLALLDMKNREYLGMVEIKNGKPGEWVEGYEPDTPEGRGVAMAAFKAHLGEGKEAPHEAVVAKALNGALKLKLKAESIKVSEPSAEMVKLGKLFGADVKLFTAESAKRLPDGFVTREGSTIYLNGASKAPLLAVMGHEMTHRMATERPEMYQELVDYLRPLLKKGEFSDYLDELKGRNAIYSGLSRGKLHEEAISDLVGSAFAKPGFWDAMAKENPDLFAKVISWVREFIDSIKSQMGGFDKASKLVTDLNKADKVIASVYAKYADVLKERGEAGETKESDVVHQFSFASEKDDVKAASAATRPVVENQSLKVVKGMAQGLYRFLFPTDRVISMMRSLAAYRPISDHLGELQRWQTIRGQYAQGIVRDAAVTYDKHVAPLLKTDADIVAFDKSLYIPSLYQMSESGNEWTDREWKKSGLQAATGKTLAEARAEVKEAIGALTPEQQVARTKVLEHIAEVRKDHLQALEDNIRGIFPPETVDKARAMNKALADAREIFKGRDLQEVEANLRAEAGPEAAAIADPIARLDATRSLKGDYFPLMRFGDHVVTGTVEGRPYRRQFDTQKDARAEMAKLQAAGADVRYDYQNQLAQKEEANIPLSFLDKYRSILEAQGITGPAQENIVNDMKALWVNTLSQYSFRGHLLQRKSVAGYEEDAHKTMLTYARRYGQAIANARYGGKVEQIFRDMNNRIDVASHEGADPESIKLMRQLHSQLYQQHISTSGENLHEITKLLTKTTFLYYLSSPSVWFVQWSQPFMTTIPKFAVDHGVTKALAVYSKAARNYISGRYSDAKLDDFETRTGGLGEKTFKTLEEIWSLNDSAKSVVAAAKERMSGEMKLAEEANATPQELASLRVRHANELKEVQEQATKAQEDQKKALSDQIDAAYAGLSEADQHLLTLNLTARQGMRDLSISHNAFDAMLSSASIKGQADKLVPGAGNAWNKTMEILALPMQKSETGSRTAAAVAAIELARAKGMNYVDAHAYARDVITDTLFNFSQANRAGWMQGNVGRIVGQFQLYRFHMLGKTFQLTKDAIGSDYAARLQAAEVERKRNADIFGDLEANRLYNEEAAALKKGRDDARKELAYMTGMGVAMAGAAGTPLAMIASNSVTDALWEALKLVFSDPNDPWDPKVSFDNAVRDSLGDTAGNVFLKGLPALAGWDISNRIGASGMADFIQGDPPPGLTGTARANWYAGRVLGPSFGMFSDTFRAMDAVNQGDMVGAVQASSPKFVKDFTKMIRTADYGVQAGGKTVLKAEDVGPYQMALMMIGINPLEVSLAQEQSREVANLSATMSQRRSGLLKQFTTAMVHDDMEARDAALAKINEWGQKQPKLKISMPELLSAAKTGMRKAQGLPTKREAETEKMLGEM